MKTALKAAAYGGILGLALVYMIYVMALFYKVASI